MYKQRLNIVLRLQKWNIPFALHVAPVYPEAQRQVKVVSLTLVSASAAILARAAFTWVDHYTVKANKKLIV